jgi:hypothetical protein
VVDVVRPMNEESREADDGYVALHAEDVNGMGNDQQSTYINRLGVRCASFPLLTCDVGSL